MRVVHVLRKYEPAEWGGTETALLQLCAGLSRHNVRSIVYGPRTAHGVVSDPLADSGCDVKRYRACLPIWGLSPQRRRQMWAVGGNLISWDLIRSLGREPDAALIHTHALGRIGGVALTVAQRRRIPLVVTIHGGFLDLPDAVRQDFLERARMGWDWGKVFGALFQSRQLLARADAVVTCNAKEAELLLQKYPGQRVRVHPHGVVADRFRKDHRDDAREAFPAIRDRQVLLVVSRIDPQKNQVWLVEQAPEIFRRHSCALLVLVGACTNERYGGELKQRIEELGLQGKIILTGGLPPADARLIGLYQDAAAVILPSQAETFGLIILESWAAGAPVISSRTSGASSLIHPGRDGWLFDLSDPGTLHDAVDRSLLRPELAQELAAAGRQRVCAEFDTGVMAGRMKALYDELIKEKHALRNSSR